ncbi:outer membrane beta-barrel protein [Pelomonas sp. UHG3]|uniref:Outer membrane beta-barrel protein n=1 Tax=Roseateles hydrophilus TaxID=2975054 RepID=A0ACC6C9K3_9BURK|nr:OmpW family outer membrane protein [Pelomonas sp. UHG3]MCY4745096.1 outer membrane beta-barrel protein [Pelomonas sp. UHG3]
MKFATPLRLAALAVAALALQPAQANEGPLMVRVRAVHLDSANKDSTGLGLSINNKTLPEVDFSYFVTPNIAAELILTYPQKQRLYSNGTEIGSLKHLPPTLTLQYHFSPDTTVRPYVGVGVNYTNFSSVKFAPAVATALKPGIKHNSFGLAWQVGTDIEISKGTYLNFDVKKVNLGTTVYSNGASAGKFKVNPTLASVGLGWRF